MKIWVNCEFSKKKKNSVSTTLHFISVWTPICPHSTVNNPKRLLELKHRHAASNPLAASLESPIGVSWLAYQLISIGNGRCCFLLSWPVAGTQKYWFESLSFWPLVSAAQFVGWLFVNRVLGFFFLISFIYFISTSKRKWVPCKCGQDATLRLHGSFHQCFLALPHLIPRGPLCLCSPPCISGSKVWKSIQHHFKALSSFCFLFFYISKHPSEVETCCVVHASAVWFDQIFWWTEGRKLRETSKGKMRVRLQLWRREEGPKSSFM